MSSKEKEQVKKKSLPPRSKREDYKLLNDGFGDDDQESSWTEEHMEDIKLFSEGTTQATLLPPSALNISFHEDDEFSGDTDLNRESGRNDSGIIQMRKELSALQQEERILKEQLSEADVLRKQIEQKKQDVKKLRGTGFGFETVLGSPKQYSYVSTVYKGETNGMFVMDNVSLYRRNPLKG